jgi:hypothetical protein
LNEHPAQHVLAVGYQQALLPCIGGHLIMRGTDVRGCKWRWGSGIRRELVWAIGLLPVMLSVPPFLVSPNAAETCFVQGSTEGRVDTRVREAAVM